MGDRRHLGLVTAGGLVAVLSGVAADHTGPALVAHMVEHLALLLVAPLLLALGHPVGRRLAGRADAWFLALVAAWVAHSAVMIFWHVPGPFDAAVRAAPLHLVEHLSMLATGYLFWSLVFVRPEADAARVPLLFVASLPGTGLGMAMMLSQHAWYATASHALGDQQFAGVIMLSAGGAVYGGVALFGFMRWLASLPTPRAVTP